MLCGFLALTHDGLPDHGHRTSVAVIQVSKFLPLVVLHQGHQGSLDVGPHLEDKLVHTLRREGGRDEGDVESLAEGCDGVYRLFVVEAKDGVDAPGEL